MTFYQNLDRRFIQTQHNDPGCLHASTCETTPHQQEIAPYIQPGQLAALHN